MRGSSSRSFSATSSSIILLPSFKTGYNFRHSHFSTFFFLSFHSRKRVSNEKKLERETREEKERREMEKQECQEKRNRDAFCS